MLGVIVILHRGVTRYDASAHRSGHNALGNPRDTARGDSPQVVLEPARDRASGSALLITHSGGRTYVIPSARADVASGRLDTALSDVTTLLAERRDDASSRTLPVIVRYAGTPGRRGTRPRKRSEPRSVVPRSPGCWPVSAPGRSRSRRPPSPTSGPRWLRAPGHDSVQPSSGVSLDRRVGVALDRSVPQIGGPAAWQRGLTGRGVKVAVLDTGIDPRHPDLAGRVERSENFSDAADAVDHHGHGTHVASIAAGTGAASGGRYKGVAPEAMLLNGKVLGDDGGDTFSGVIAGMEWEWAVAQGAAVVDLSLGGGPTDGTDDVSMAVNRLSRDTGAPLCRCCRQLLRLGTIRGELTGAADAAVAVGNLERDSSLSDTSCRGPRTGDRALKPEISAPGTGIVAARAAGTDLGEPVGDRYTTLSGTSMATPHVCGVAALVAQAHPDWRAAQLRARLMSTADPQRARVDEEGAGRVDADQATEPSVTVDSGELELGTLPWPQSCQGQDQPRAHLPQPHWNSGDTATGGRYVVTSVAVSHATDSTPGAARPGGRRRDPTNQELHRDTGHAQVTTHRDHHPGQGRLIANDRTMSYLLKDNRGVVSGGFLVDLGMRFLTAGIGATPSRQVTTGSSEFALGAELIVPPYRARVRGGDAFTVRAFFDGPSPAPRTWRYTTPERPRR